MAFLQHIPCEWISRRHASPGDLGWAPFRGQLSKKQMKRRAAIEPVIGHVKNDKKLQEIEQEISFYKFSKIQKKEISKICKERLIPDFGMMA